MCIRDRANTTSPSISAVDVKNGYLNITMSSELLHSGRDVVIWVNGAYVGSVQNDVSYYIWKSNFEGGAILTPATPVKDGDLIQIGVVNGENSPGASELLYQNSLNGIGAITRAEGKAAIRMSSELVNSGQRVVIWYDGAYAGEVQSGSAYYSEKTDVNGGYLITPGTPATADTLINIGIVPGTPGMALGTPAAAQTLYRDLRF